MLYKASVSVMAVSLLKRLLQRRGYGCDVHYLNILFAKEIRVDLYSTISDASAFFPEWFFSSALFGKTGLDLLKNDWDALSGPLGEQLKSQLATIVGGEEGACERIAIEAVSHFVNTCLETIDWSKYAVVGFSVTFVQTTASLLLARKIKQQHPEVKIIFGGASVDSEMALSY